MMVWKEKRIFFWYRLKETGTFPVPASLGKILIPPYFRSLTKGRDRVGLNT